LRLISNGYEGRFQNKRRVGKKLPTFMAKETLFNGKTLHTLGVQIEAG
jgi:hypothetical protein